MDLSACVDLVREQPDVLALYLFGSQARQTAGPGSDVDPAVLLAPGADAWRSKLDLGARLSQRLGRPVDLIVMGEDLELTFRVLTEGRRLHEAARDEVRSREALLASQYYDYAPFIQSYLASVAREYRRG
ncbi:MAG: nucleotidyltransferase domain-containing protein [Armatimonadetes bacterium]|nr:nucleotidyltransferase domain-containing protein [Armatimonadota bacterium]